MDNEKFTKEQVIEAIPGTGGVKTEIAKRLGCHRHTVRRYVREYDEVAEAFEDERETFIDDTITQLKRAAVEEAQPWAIRYVLSTIGKHRGFTKRQEVTGADGGPQQHEMTSVKERDKEEDAEYIAGVLATIDAIPGRSNGNVAEDTQEPVHTPQADD